MTGFIGGEQESADRVRAEALSGRLPSALLFSGSRCSGRLTAALEAARTAGCSESAGLDCSCRSCREHRAGSDPYTLLLLGRDLVPEIKAAAAPLLREIEPDVGAIAHFTLQVRKLIGRNRPELFDESTAARQMLNSSFEIDEMLAELHRTGAAAGVVHKPGKSDRKAIKKMVEKIIAASEKIAGTSRSGTIPVAVIRKIASWIVTSPEHEAKTIIIEGLENYSDASQNALLKILEEPPKRTCFIVISESAEALPRTILSRLRRYHFPSLTESFQRRILIEQFREDPENYDGLETFFMTAAGIDCRALRGDAERFAALLLNRRESDSGELQDLFRRITLERLFDHFLTELIGVLEDELRDRLLTPGRASELLQSIQTAYTRNSVWNQQPSLALETMYYRIRYGRL